MKRIEIETEARKPECFKENPVVLLLDHNCLDILSDDIKYIIPSAVNFDLFADNL